MILSWLYYFSFIGYKIYTSAFCSATRKDRIIDAWEGCSAHLFVHQNVAFLKLLNIPQQNMILCALHLVLKEFNFFEYSFKTILCMKPKFELSQKRIMTVFWVFTPCNVLFILTFWRNCLHFQGYCISRRGVAALSILWRYTGLVEI